jgi:hypothetical protein
MRVLVLLPTYNRIENIETYFVGPASHFPTPTYSSSTTAPTALPIGQESRRRPGQDRRASSRCQAGLGSAYRAGCVGLARGYDVMIEMDADLSHDPAVLPELVAAVEQGADLRSARLRARRLDSRLEVEFLSRAISAAAASTPEPCCGCRSDATAGFRAYHRRALRAIPLDDVRRRLRLQVE